MPLKPRPLKTLLLCSSTQWHNQSLRPFSHLPSFKRITARSYCIVGSWNIWASVSLVLITCRYNSTIFLCIHLKVEIKPVTLKSHCDFEVWWQIDVTKCEHLTPCWFDLWPRDLQAAPPLLLPEDDHGHTSASCWPKQLGSISQQSWAHKDSTLTNALKWNFRIFYWLIKKWS